jgi:hypothetical protein
MRKNSAKINEKKSAKICCIRDISGETELEKANDKSSVQALKPGAKSC